MSEKSASTVPALDKAVRILDLLAREAKPCLLYNSYAADDRKYVGLSGRWNNDKTGKEENRNKRGRF